MQVVLNCLKNGLMWRMSEWHQNITNLCHLLESLTVLDSQGNDLDADEAFSRLTEFTFRIHSEKATILIIAHLITIVRICEMIVKVEQIKAALCSYKQMLV